MIKNNNVKQARVISQHRGKYRVLCEGSEFWADVTGKLIYAATSQLDYPVVGDLVKILAFDKDSATIESIIPRKSLIKRKAAGEDEMQPIAANVDNAFIVQAIGHDFNLNRLERYLAIVKVDDIEPAIILNKIDLAQKEEIDNIIAVIKDRFKDILVLTTSASKEYGTEDLLNSLKKDCVYCFIGSSGVGKTSIINRLLSTDILKTKEISISTNKGKHTTTHRELFVLKNGSMVIDNPGMREVGIADTGQALEDAFSEMSILIQECKFTNCSHQHEKGCAVLEALSLGKLSEEQYTNYIKLKKEADFYSMTKFEKRQKGHTFGKMIKAHKRMNQR